MLSRTEGACRHTVFMPGCALAAASPGLLGEIHAHLSRHLPGMGLLLRCCATPVYSVGDMETFTRYHDELVRLLETQGIHTVITACGNCYATLKATIPGLTVRSLYEVLCDTGIPRRDYRAMPPAALHDSCSIRMEAGVQDSVRELLRIMKYPFEEFPLNRARTVCCGNGAMLPLRDGEMADKLAHVRRAQTVCGVIVCYCQACADRLAGEGKRTLHLLDLAFGEPRPDFMQKGAGRIGRWLNRYRAKRLISELRHEKEPVRSGQA